MVLCLQVPADGIMQRLWPLQHPLQVLGLQPGIVVRVEDAVVLEGFGNSLGNRWAGSLRLHGLRKQREPQSQNNTEASGGCRIVATEWRHHGATVARLRPRP